MKLLKHKSAHALLNWIVLLYMLTVHKVNLLPAVPCPELPDACASGQKQCSFDLPAAGRARFKEMQLGLLMHGQTKITYLHHLTLGHIASRRSSSNSA